jgi:chitinase
VDRCEPALERWAFAVGLLIAAPAVAACSGGAEASDTDSTMSDIGGAGAFSASAGGSGPNPGSAGATSSAGAGQVSPTAGAPAAGGNTNPSAGGMGGSAEPEGCGHPAWQPGMDYKAGDRVMYQGQAYVAEHDNPGYDPVVSSYFWEPIACGEGSGGASGNAGGAGGSPSYPEGCALDRVMGSAEWHSIYSRRRNSFYTYEAVCSALERFPAFANGPNADANKREAAAFFANVSRETGELEYIEQIAKDPPRYFGRGPLQITHDFNYRSAGEYLGIDLLNNPDRVATDPVLTWKVALWFWMVYEFNGNCHDAIVNNADFGQTIRVINGGFECNGPNEAANQRINYYRDYTSRLGVDPGNSLTCW